MAKTSGKIIRKQEKIIGHVDSSGVLLTEEKNNWWKQPKEKIAKVIESVVATIDDNNSDLQDRFSRFARMYGNYDATGWSSLSAFNNFEQSSNRPVFNIIQSCIDTIHSKIARDNPQPYFITAGADYFDKLKAEKLTMFVQGIWEAADFYDIANNKVFRDASIYGLGGVQFIHNEEDSTIDIEWIFINELKVDQYDAQKGKPRSIHRSKMVPKELLLEKYPDKIDVIHSASRRFPLFKLTESVVDFCIVTESWHLKCGDETGRHVVSIADKSLLDEDYDFDWFPIVWFNYMQKPIGMYGRGISEMTLSGQIEINKILLQIQQAQELQASPVILVDNNSEIADEVLLSNNIARMIPYRNGTNPPQFLSPTALSQEVYEHLRWWIQSMYNEVGISQTSAGGEKTPGVNSAVAMRTMVDIESTRFIQVSKNWEKFFVKCAEITVKMGKCIYEKDSSFTAKYMDKRSKVIKEIPWKQVNLPDDKFIIKCDTISAFPASAAGRIQTITDFISNNYLSRERGLELLQIDPDLEDEVKLQTSSLRLTEKRLSEMVEDGTYFHPEKYINLKLCLNVSQATYNQLCIDNCPEDRLQLVRQWIGELLTLLSGQDPTVLMLQQVFGGGSPPQMQSGGVNPPPQPAAQ